jgi:hypothetical protein
MSSQKKLEGKRLRVSGKIREETSDPLEGSAKQGTEDSLDDKVDNLSSENDVPFPLVDQADSDRDRNVDR